jgi:16S rRNA C967 or C1407 C5-methylase (RsmB/RsmF family)
MFQDYKAFIPNYSQFLSTLNEKLPTTAWFNPDQISKDNLERFLKKHGTDYRFLSWNNEAFLYKSKVSLGVSLSYALGQVHLQEEVSMIPGFIAKSLKPHTVLDMCASPGNKAAQIGVTLKAENSYLIANEPRLPRHSQLKSNLLRMGVPNTIYTKYDGASFPILNNKVDLVYADVPCSCEGTSRKNKISRINQSELEKLTNTQLAILTRGFENLKLGGHLIYSTCTYNPLENEAVVNSFLKSEIGAQAEILPIQIEGLKFSQGIESFDSQIFSNEVQKSIRIWPHQNDSGGFFVTLIRRRALGNH